MNRKPLPHASCLLPVAGALLLATPAAAAEPTFTPSTMRDVAQAFNRADADNNSALSREEYRMMRMNVIGKDHVGSYRSDSRAQAGSSIDMSFASLDLNRDGKLSQEEFQSLAANAHSNMNRSTAQNTTGQTTTAQNTTAMNNQSSEWQSWQPDYVTVTYYLMRNPVDTESLEGQTVTNLKGDKVGEIDRIIRDKDSGKHYAMIDIRGTPMYRINTGSRRDEAGVPLDDLLWDTSKDALFVSARGDEWLREADAHVVENFETVDRLYMGR